MKRTTLWVTVAATGVQLAALGLCAWAMQTTRERRPVLVGGRSPDVLVPPPEPTRWSAPVADLVAATIEVVAAPIEEPKPVVPDVPEPAAVVPEPAPVAVVPEPAPVAVAPEPAPVAVAPEPEPVAVAPEPAVYEIPELVVAAPEPEAVTIEPETGSTPQQSDRPIPRFITNFADDETQIVVAEAGEPHIVFGVYVDGNVRCVDVDNGCYAGKAEGSRARMREVAGSRAFTVQMEQAEDGSFVASFVGGLHDGQIILLLPVVAAGRA